MANILMPPPTVVAQQVASSAGVDRKAQLPVGDEGSFARHLERKVRGEQSVSNNLLGAPAKKTTAGTKESDGATADLPATVEALLQQVMNYLKEMAEKPGTEPGQWTFQLQDVGLLEKLAGQAGMDAGSLALLKKQMEEQGGLPLADLFAALEKNFKGLSAAKPVTVAETHLPLLETFLSKLGVEPETISQLDAQGVNGLDQLDLAAFLKGLQDVLGKGQGGESSITLTEAEFEQFSAMLAEAGVPAEKIAAMFPEQMTLQQKALAGLHPEQGNAVIEMSLDRLANILQQALAAVEEARPKVDLPGFLQEMDVVLGQTGFQGNGVGWSPVVQGAMKASYDQMRDMIAQNQSQERKIEIMVKNDAVREEWQMSGTETTDTIVVESALGQGGELADGDIAGNQTATAVLDATNDDELAARIKGAGGVEMKAAVPVQTEPAVKVQAPRLHLATELQQFTVEQISQGVLRGLKNSEHHLTLTLYPKELGEVKVDLQVRGSQLSATFVMENQKVKEAMESNMGDFKENLERRGFSLQSMSVSVGQQDRGNDGGQRFVEAWEQIAANQKREKIATIEASSLAFSPNDQATLKQGSISLFV